MSNDDRLFPVALGSGAVDKRQQAFTFKIICDLMPVLLQTGGYILLCKRGAGGFPAQGRRLCAVHSQEEGKSPRKPPRPAEGGDGREPGAHHQEGGDTETVTLQSCL